METEQIGLIKVFKKNDRVIVEYSDDCDKYMAFGIIKTIGQTMEKQLSDEWTEGKT